MDLKTVKLLGIEFNPMSMNQLISLITKLILKKSKGEIIAHQNLHGTYLFHHFVKMRDFYKRSSYIFADGMSLIFLSNVFGQKLSREQRTTSVDWFLPLMRLAAKNQWRVFFLGSKPGIADRAAQILKSEIPKLQIKTRHGYFDVSPGSLENEDILRQISSFKPHILLVGMGMPRQEEWILDNHEAICSNVILPVGACMDYIAGTVRTPPRWLGRLGLEWFYRLLCEPKRLWRRYLIEPLYIMKLFLPLGAKGKNI